MSNTVTSSEKLSVAALISVILRRKANRTIDVKWLIENEEYARKIIELCREQNMDDLNEYANHLEFLMFDKAADGQKEVQKSKAVSPKPEPATAFADTIEENENTEAEDAIDQSKYVGRLR